MADTNIKICELSTSLSNPNQYDFFAIDKKSLIADAYTTVKVSGLQLKNYILDNDDNANRTVLFKGVSASIDATEDSETNKAYVKVREMSTSDNTDNAASTKWVNSFWTSRKSQSETINGNWTFSGDISTNVDAGMALITDSNKRISKSSVSSAQLNQLRDINTSKTVQSQLDEKASKSNPVFTGVINTPLAANSVLITNASKQLAASTVTATELGYLSNASGNIQSQIDGKSPRTNPSFIGTITTQMNADSVIITNASKQLVASSISSAKLGYLSDVTGNLQSQLNSKAQDENTVHRSGSEDITGEKTLKDTNPIIKSSIASVSRTSGTVCNTGCYHADAYGRTIGYVGSVCNANGSQETGIWTYDNTGASRLGSIVVGRDSSNNIYTSAPTPASTSSDTSIATTEWVKNNCSSFPDYSVAATEFASGSTTTTNGFLVLKIAYCRTSTLTIENNTFTFESAYGDGWNTDTIMFPVAANTVVTHSNFGWVKFIPCK